MQPLTILFLAILAIAYTGYEVIYYLPYVFSHITEILAYISVGLVIVGTGAFVVNFGGK